MRLGVFFFSFFGYNIHKIRYRLQYERRFSLSMSDHGKKMIAPIIITVLIVLYYIGIISLFMAVNEISITVKFLLSVIPLAAVGVLINVLISRIEEIRSGEEDDLSKY